MNSSHLICLPLEFRSKFQNKFRSHLTFFLFFAAIVIVVLGIIAGFSITYWAKSNDKWCFAKPDTKPDYNQAPTSDPDIVKTKKEDTVKEEKEKSDKVVDNPV